MLILSKNVSIRLTIQTNKVGLFSTRDSYYFLSIKFKTIHYVNSW